MDKVEDRWTARGHRTRWLDNRARSAVGLEASPQGLAWVCCLALEVEGENTVRDVVRVVRQEEPRLCRDSGCAGGDVGAGSVLGSDPAFVERGVAAESVAIDGHWSGRMTPAGGTELASFGVQERGCRSEVTAVEEQEGLARVVGVVDDSVDLRAVDVRGGLTRCRHDRKHVGAYLRLVGGLGCDVDDRRACGQDDDRQAQPQAGSSRELPDGAHLSAADFSYRAGVARRVRRGRESAFCSHLRGTPAWTSCCCWVPSGGGLTVTCVPARGSVRLFDGSTREMPLVELTAAAVLSAVPWRAVRSHRGQRHLPGWYWSATMGGHLVYESRLELARLLLADFDPEVVGIAAQPFLVQDADRRHVPDFLLRRVDGSVVIVNVKPAEQLDVVKVADALAWAGGVFRERGWEHEVWSGADAQLLASVRFLAGYRRAQLIAPVDIAAIWSPGTVLTIAAAEAALADVGVIDPRPVVLGLLWSGRLRTDLERPLTSDSNLEVLW